MNGSRIRRALACVFSLAALPISGQVPSSQIPVQQPAPESKIKTRVSLVNTPVTVLNAKGELVYNLDAKDFQVIDNGVPQKITHLELRSNPLSLLVLIETSSRVESLLPEMRMTGIVFTHAVMGAEDEATVVGFNDSVDELVDFTTDHETIQNTINKLRVGSNGAKLFDAMAIGEEMLSHARSQTPDSLERQRVMVIMSEGLDLGSEMRLAAVLWQAQRSNITVYSLGISTALAAWKAPAKETRPRIMPEGFFPQPGMPGTVQTPETEATRYGYGNLLNHLPAIRNQFANPLDIAASKTGGQFTATFGGKSMQKALDKIGAELHGQYSLTYELTGTNAAGYHEIKVRVNREHLTVRARPGYYIAPPEG